MDESWWYLTRASGIVATILAVGVAGVRRVLLGAQHRQPRTPAWWLDLHNYLGGLALDLHRSASVGLGAGPELGHRHRAGA